MPKAKRKDRGGGRRSTEVVAGSDDDVDGQDSLSIISNVSEQQSYIRSTDGSDDQDVDDSSAHENFEDKVKACIEGTSQKSAKSRVESLTSLRAAFSKKYISEFVSQRRMTITDSIERCLKKGKGDEQGAAAMCAVLMLVQLGPGDECDEVYSSLLPVLKTLLADASIAPAARSMIAEALGLCTFVAVDVQETTREVMSALESVFCASYLKGDGTPSSHPPEIQALHASALSAWTLLLSVVPASIVLDLYSVYLSRLPGLLLSSDVEVRISAGEAIALIYELARYAEQEFEDDSVDGLCLQLKHLATESNKYRAKKDRRQQRASFRDILASVETGDFTKERIRVNAYESFVIDCWTTRTQYNALCHALGTGMSIHLKENNLLREIFDLGAPISDIGAISKASKVERHMARDAAFKARTKTRSKQRDKKSTTVATDI